VGACTALRAARAELSEALAAKERALVAVWRSGVPKSRVAEHVNGALAAAGWSDTDIAGVGVAPASVRSALDRR